MIVARLSEEKTLVTCFYQRIARCVAKSFLSLSWRRSLSHPHLSSNRFSVCPVFFDLGCGGQESAYLQLCRRFGFEDYLKREKRAGFSDLDHGMAFGVVLIPIVWAAATKWPEVKSFSLTVLGCYFPFLVLESALSITRIRRESAPSR